MDLPELKFDSTPKSDSIGLPDLNFSPADVSREMQDAQFGVAHPYLRAMQDTANQGPGMLFKSLYNSIPGMSMNVPPAFAKLMANYNPQNVQTNPIAKVGSQIEGGIGGMFGTLPFAAPITSAAGMLPLVGNAGKLALGGITPQALGFGATGGLQAFGNNQPVLPAVGHGAAQGAAYGIGGILGSKMAQAAASPASAIFNKLNPLLAKNITKFAPNVGTGAGMAAAGALTAPAGQKISSAMLGGGFGAISPMGTKAPVTQEQYDEAVKNHSDVYREILNPSQGTLRNIEIKSGKDINDALGVAAKEGLVLNKDINGKLDTADAINQTIDSAKPIYKQLNQILDSNPSNQFDLEKIGESVKAQFDNPESQYYIKNAKEANAAKAQVDSEIGAEVERNGSQFVNGADLNKIKQGMWGKSYNPMAPNDNDVARQIGYQMKDAIEKAYPGNNIKDLNKEAGKYLTLQKILENSHGKVIQRGKLGKYVNEVIGGGTGLLAGAAIPVPFLREATMAAGGFIGKEIGDKFTNFQTDPERITSSLADRLSNMNVINPKTNSLFKPLLNASITPQFPDEVSRMEGEGGRPVASTLFKPPLNTTTPPQFPDEVSRMEGEGGRPVPPSEITPEAKQQAKEQVNQYWLGKIMGQFNPLGKQIGKMAVPGLVAGGLMFGGNANASTIGQQNNNPINLKAFDKWDGMTGKDKYGHAQFKTVDMGIRAGLKNLDNHFKNNPDQTLGQYLKTFAEANGDKEAKFIANHIGADVNTPLSQISTDEMIVPLAKFESKTNLTPEQIQSVRARYFK